MSMDVDADTLAAANTLVDFSKEAREIAPDADPETISDVLSALPGKTGGARRKRVKGGAFESTKAALRESWATLTGGVGTLPGVADATAAFLIKNLASLTAAGGTIAVLNHPTVFGNLAQLAAAITTQATNATITSTWGDWLAALRAAGDAGARLATLLASQTLQGPVVPFAVATALMTWRASKSGKTISALIAEDAGAAGSGLARLLTSQIQAFTDAYEREGRRLGPDQLRQLAAAIQPPTGEGAAAMSADARRPGVPAARPTEAGIGQVPGSRRVGDIPAAARAVAEAAAAPGRPAAPAAAPRTRGVKRPPPPPPAEDDMDADGEDSEDEESSAEQRSKRSKPAAEEDEGGGRRRRKTRSGRKPRRRATLRKRRSSRKALKFVY